MGGLRESVVWSLQVLNLKGIINTTALWFLLGLFIVPFIYAAFVQPDIYIEATPFMLIIAGVLVGFGTRLGSGCTSGHGICGISRLSKRSIIATDEFYVRRLYHCVCCPSYAWSNLKMKNVWAFIWGGLFSIGLMLSGMSNPAKVIGFLDIFGHWDASLAFVMMGAIAIAFIPFQKAVRQPHPQTVLW